MALRNQNHKRKGFTLTEIAIVLGVIGLILGAIWAASQNMIASNRTKQAASQAAFIANNWKSVYGSTKIDIADGTDITKDTANNNFSPPDMLSTISGYCHVGNANAAACTLAGAWDGSWVTVSTNTPNNAILVSYNGLTQAACENYANNAEGLAGLIRIDIGPTTGTLHKYVLPPYGTDSIPTTINIDTYCSDPTSNSVNIWFSMS